MPRAAHTSPTPRRSAEGSPGGGVSLHTPPPGCYIAAIAALRLDLEMHRQKAVEVEALIVKLTTYTNGAAPVPANGRRRRRNQVQDEKDAKRRALASAKTKAWRERRKKAEAAAAEDLKKRLRRRRRQRRRHENRRRRHARS
jgi:hypothetical protein